MGGWSTGSGCSSISSSGANPLLFLEASFFLKFLPKLWLDALPSVSVEEEEKPRKSLCVLSDFFLSTTTVGASEEWLEEEKDEWTGGSEGHLLEDEHVGEMPLDYKSVSKER